MVVLEQIGDAAIPLLALLYPLMPPSKAHSMLLGLGGSYYVFFSVRFALFLAGQPTYMSEVVMWTTFVNGFILDIGALGRHAPSFRNLQPEDARADASVIVGLSLLGWVPYVYFSLATIFHCPSLLELDGPFDAFAIRCFIVSFVLFALSIPTYYRILTRILAIVLSRLAARRVRWLFRFWPEDIEANAEVRADIPLKDTSE